MLARTQLRSNIPPLSEHTRAVCKHKPACARSISFTNPTRQSLSWARRGLNTSSPQSQAVPVLPRELSTSGSLIPPSSSFRPHQPERQSTTSPGGNYERCTLHAERGQPIIHGLFHGPTNTWTYVVVGQDEETCVIIDPVLDYDNATQVITTESANALMVLVNDKGYKVDRILETHAHADHLTGAQYLKSQLPKRGLASARLVPVCIGAGITEVQSRFAPRYGLQANPDDFDVLFRRGPTPIASPHGATDSFTFGGTTCAVLHLPGHTPDHAGYLVGEHLFCGDVIFLPDVGSARADFPGGSAESLYSSLQTIMALPDETKIYVGHDYPPAGSRPPQDQTTVALQRQHNVHLQGDGCPTIFGFPDETDPSCRQAHFIELRQARDRKLGAPRLLHPSLQVNIRAGRLPSDGFFRIPFTQSTADGS